LNVIAYCVAYGIILAKMGRVYIIFNNPSVVSLQVCFLPSVPVFEVEYHTECSTDNTNSGYKIVCDCKPMWKVTVTFLGVPSGGVPSTIRDRKHGKCVQVTLQSIHIAMDLPPKQQNKV